MQLRAFPDDVRTALADLALAVEQGRLTQEAADQITAEMVAELRVILGLDDSWQSPPSPPERHAPNGRTMAFWKGRSDAAVKGQVAELVSAARATFTMQDVGRVNQVGTPDPQG